MASMEGALMAEKTGIEWTDHTFNPTWGCFKVSPGCTNCYAETLATRFGYDVFGPPATTERRTFGAKHWAEPLKWNRQAEKEGRRHRVFCASMSDVFEVHPTTDAEREKLWPLIRSTPWLDWLLLTKRPQRIAECLPDDWADGYPNVWLGTSVESETYWHRIDDLLEVPASVHFISAEPLLGPIDWSGFEGDVDWVIVGGESGDGFREMPMEAFERLVADAKAGGASVFVKQDSGRQSGRQGRISDEYWALKEWPK